MKNLTVEKINLSDTDSFDFEAYSGGTVDLSDYGFDAPVVYDIESMKTSDKTPVLYNHLYSDPLGHITNFDKGEQVKGSGLFSVDSPRTTEVRNSKGKGFPYQLSLGLGVKDATLQYFKEGKVAINNREIDTPCYVFRNTVIDEVTVCVKGRDSNTQLLSQETVMTIKNSNAPLSVDRILNSDPATTTPPTKEPEAPSTPPVTPPAPPVVTNAPQAPPAPSPLVMITKVTGLMNKYPGYGEFIQNSLESGVTLEVIENQLTLLNKGPGLPTPTPGKKDGSNHELSASFDFALGRDEKKILKQYGEEVTNKAGEKNLFSLRELLVDIANANGGRFNGHSDIESCVSFLHSKTVTNTYSSIDLPNFLLSSAQRMKDDLWEIESPMAIKMLQAVSKKDFRVDQSLRPVGGNIWERVNDKGKITHFQYTSEMTYETRLATIAQLLVISREQVINDDLGVIKDLLTMMVEGSIMYPDVQWLKLLFETASSNFRQTGVNYFTGAGAALTRDNLSTIYDQVRKIRIQKQDKTWVNLDSTGWYLVTGPKLEQTAFDLVNQPIIMPAGGANLSRTGTKNYWYGRLEPMTWAQLGNDSLYASAEDDDWLLLPKNQRYSPYSVSFLGSARRPTIENVNLPMEFLGFGTRGYFDINVQERESAAVAICRPSK